MLEVLEATEQPKRHPAAFTPESARLAAQKSVEVRKAKANARKAYPVATLPAPTPTLPNAPTAKDLALARVLGQLDAIDRLMDRAADAKTWDMLSRSKERLAKVWFVLGNIAATAPIKANAREQKQSLVSWEPKPAAPIAPAIPQPVVSAPSITPESCEWCI